MMPDAMPARPRRNRNRRALRSCPVIAAAACAAALVAAASSLGTALARAQADAGSTTIAVTMTDAKVKLAATRAPLGSVIFKIVNKGKIPRDFKISGKRTPKIASGKSATLNVEFTLTGTYSYYSVGQGHAGNLSGVFAVVDPCTKPAVSTVSVQLMEAPITLSQTTVPCGTVTFVVTNVGTIVHSFNVTADGREGLGPRLNPGQTVSMTVHFSVKGSALYYCAEPEHGELYGMVGYLTVD
jgi:uncharacterized cupredoxin-like copper-binding protein